MDFCHLLKKWAKVLAKNICSIVNIVKYSQNLLDYAKRSATDVLKFSTKEEDKKTAEATGW